jgi:hypothetical protein
MQQWKLGKLTAVIKYGKIPLPLNAKINPWEEVPVDLVGS